MSTLRARCLAMLVAVTSGFVVVVLSGCAPASVSPPSGSHDPDVVAAREEVAAEQEGLLATAALGEPLSVGVQDYCKRGTYSAVWGPHDSYYWSCGRVTSWIVGTDTEDPAELIAAYRAHLTAIGCDPDEADFDMAAQYWAMYGIPGENANGARTPSTTCPASVHSARTVFGSV
ncbi:hypothetical protein ACI3KY_01190 [Microbacterium sp. ZW T2_14]|uniref:hypothetical protein n=1 Tax=Microbacterium sp. ZW T2_14 TaxID=3378079 RepID=UPI003854B4DC